MISVCMASHNGEPYIAEQVDSILAQLSAGDELIIVDDCSGDWTCEILATRGDRRLNVLRNETRRGHVQSFARALNASRGDLIALADQDDLWPAGRLETMLGVQRQSDAQLVAGNFTLMNRDGQVVGAPSRHLYGKDSDARWRNLIGIFLGRRPYYGCAMLLHRSLLDRALPIPGYVESHDLWLAMAANISGRITHLEEPVLLKREHCGNLSARQRRPWPQLLASRAKMFASVAALTMRGQPRKSGSER